MKGMKRSVISEYLGMIGRKGGRASGKARMLKLTPEQRSEIARKAALARWAKAKRKAGAKRRK